MGTIYPGAPGATGRQARARSLAEHATSNTTEEANDRCRTPDDSTAEEKHSDHNRTTPATRQAPAWAPFTFQGLSSRAKACGSWPFREGPTSSTHLDPSPLAPCSLIAIRRFNRRADEKAHGVVRCPRAVPHGKIGGTMARTAECAAPEGKPGPRRMDDGDRDAGVHEGEPKQGVRPHLVGRDRLVQARKEAPGVEGVSGRLHRVEERQEMTAATAPGAARGRAREGASRRKELEDDHDQEH